MKEHDDVTALSKLKLIPLRKSWLMRFHCEPPPFGSVELLLRAYVYRLEASAAGDLKAAAKKRLTELARKFEVDADFDPAPRSSPSVGSALVRDWNGVRHVVLVTTDGYKYLDKTYASLTQVAKAITGTHQSGPRFFDLNDPDKQRRTP